MSFKRKVLLTVLISLIGSSVFFVVIRQVLDPKYSKVKPEKIDDAMARIYENFIHKTKYSYDRILESGTDYSNQEKVFIELTKKMKDLENVGPDFMKNADYQKLQDILESEISKNRSAFETFYAKATGSTPEELKKLVEERNKQYDIVLEGN